MARIVLDRGLQRLSSGVSCYVFEMDCGCEIRIDERALLALRPGRSHMTECMARAARVAEVHDCDIVVYQAPERYRREAAARRRYEANMTLEPPIRYMGVPVIPDPMIGFNELWDYMQPNPRPERSRGQPVAPREAPEAPERVLRAAIFDHQTPMGFQPDKKPQEDQPRPDRFDLIELD